MIKDKVSGDYVPYYPNWKRWVKRVLLTYPFIILCAVFHVMIFFCVICIEIWVRDLYQGPFKAIMVIYIHYYCNYYYYSVGNNIY